VAEPQHVAVAKVPPPGDSLAVHKRAVARQALVHQRALVAHDLELRVESGDLVVPGELDVRRGAAADPQLGHVRVDHQQLPLALLIPIREERAPGALRLDLSFQLDGRDGMRPGGVLGHGA